MSLGYGLSPVMRSRSAPVASASSPNNAGFSIRGTYGAPFDEAMKTWSALAQTRGGGPGLKAAKHAAFLAKQVGDLLEPYAKTKDGDPLASSVAYPAASTFGDRLRTLAGLISKPLGIRVATVDAPSDFDTHSNQRNALNQALPEISQALGAFQADLEARGVADRVLTFVWSEFGRRPHDNDSGTDHGAGGLAWVQGTRARSGLLSEYPSLREFDDDDNLKVTVDFRTVYASLIEQWLGTDAGAVLPNAGALGRVQLVRRGCAGATCCRWRWRARRWPGPTGRARRARPGRRRAPQPARPRSASACASTASRCTAAASCRGACG
jgi:hypothetical protein